MSMMLLKNEYCSVCGGNMYIDVSGLHPEIKCFMCSKTRTPTEYEEQQIVQITGVKIPKANFKGIGGYHARKRK